MITHRAFDRYVPIAINRGHILAPWFLWFSFTDLGGFSSFADHFNRQSKRLKLWFNRRRIADNDPGKFIRVDQCADRIVQSVLRHAAIFARDRSVIIVGPLKPHIALHRAKHVARCFKATRQFADTAADNAFTLFGGDAVVG